MSFKAKIDVHVYMSVKQIDQSIRDEVYKFTKTRIKFNKSQIVKYEDKLHVNPFDTVFANNTHYKLAEVEKDGDTSYRILIQDFPITLILTKWQTFKLKWTFKKTWIQSEDANWLKQSITTSLITAIFSTVTYFIGQSVGFSKGYDNGLKEGKQSMQIPIQQKPQKFAQKDSTSKFDTTSK